jgi:hypothetical protein
MILFVRIVVSCCVAGLGGGETYLPSDRGIEIRRMDDLLDRTWARRSKLLHGRFGLLRLICRWVLVISTFCLCVRGIEKNQDSRSTMTLRFRPFESFLRNLDAVFVEESVPAVLDITAFAAIARAVHFDLDCTNFTEGFADALDCGVGLVVGVC